MFTVEHPEDGVAVLRIDDGKVNALSPALLEAFPEAWTKATDGGRAVVLLGNDRAFSAGLDLKTLPGLDEEGLRAFFQDFVRMLADLYGHPGPVVTAVDGPALAGGAFLALAGDVRLVTHRARIGFTEVDVGVPFPPPVVTIAQALLPVSEQGPALLQGVQREGMTLVTKGWAHEALNAPQLQEAAVETARELAGKSAPVYAQTKRALRRPLLEALEAFEGDALERYVAALTGGEARREIEQRFAQALQRSG